MIAPFSTVSRLRRERLEPVARADEEVAARVVHEQEHELAVASCAGVAVYVVPSAGATSDRSSIATIASSFVRMCPVDQLVNAMLTLR